MKKCAALFIVLLFLAFPTFAQYQPSCPYLQDPGLAIGYVDSCASFWVGTLDTVRGGFYSNVDRQGEVISAWGLNKNTITQSRNAYGFVRAYMLTGNDLYLTMADSALQFLYRNAWDDEHGGWFSEISATGVPLNTDNDKSAFDQHYALLGPLAYYEATSRQLDYDEVMAGYANNETVYWDSRPGYEGYYDAAFADNSDAWGKSFNATVDAITTHVLTLDLMTGESQYRDRLEELADESIDHLAGSMPDQAIGFVELYDSDWNWDDSQTMTIMGHVLKTGWCLARLDQIDPNPDYLSTAEDLVQHVYDNGYDHVLGGPYKDFDRTTGQMLMWGNPDTCKAWWQMEQAVTAGLQLYDLTRNDLYLQMADETLNFFMQYFVDHEYGEVYSDRTRYGGFAWNEAKGSGGKAGYHSIELGYYVYLYGNLLLLHEPVTLHYRFVTSNEDRDLALMPLAMDPSKLRIRSVLHEGAEYTDFVADTRVLHLPAGTEGHFAVTFESLYPETAGETPLVAMPQGVRLGPNYPNPFNPSTTLAYELPSTGNVTLSVYDITGREVARLVDGIRHSGSHRITFDASTLASGIYFARLQASGQVQTRKLMLVK